MSYSWAYAQDCGRNMLKITNRGSYVVTPDVPSLHLTHGFTIECWDSLFSADVHATLIGKGTYPFYYGLFADTSSAIGGVIRRTVGITLDGPPIDFQHWHHYALTFNPNDSLRLYVDGEEVASQSTAGTFSLDSSADSLRIGDPVLNNGITGAIDEVRIWNYARPQDSIKNSLYHLVQAGDSGLVLYYSFDDDVGSTRIHDFSGHAHDGHLRGGYAEVVPCTSPLVESSPGYRLIAKESKMVIPLKRCTPSFDTVIHLGNIGTDSLVVTSIGCSSSAFSITPHSPLTLAPDTAVWQPIRIHFAPQRDGRFSGTLIITDTTAHACAGSITIDLQASYDSVGLLFDPAPLSFDSVVQCNLPETRKEWVRNTSDYDSVSIVGFSIPSGSGFSISPAPPIAIAPKDSVQLTVKMSSGPRGPVQLNLGFDLDQCSREVVLKATGLRQLASLSIPTNLTLSALPATIQGYTIDTFVTVTNIGDVPDAIRSVTASDTSLHVIDTRAGIFISPGQSLNVPIRFNTKGCGTIQSKLHVISTICSVDVGTIVSVDLIPPQPLTAASMDVGRTCQPLDDTFTVVNPNDQAVRLTNTSFSKDSVVFIDPTFVIPKTIAAHDSLKVPFRFFPMGAGDYTDTIFLHSLPCGTGMMVVRGSWGFKGLAFSPSNLDFGRGCTTDPITKSVTLTNSSSRPDTLYSESYSGTSRFKVGIFPQPLILNPGESLPISFTYTPTLGSKDTGSFPLVSKDGCLAAILQLRGSREIAKASWSIPSAEFNTVCPGQAKDISFILRNEGIDSIDINNISIAGSGFTLVRGPKTIGKQDTFAIRFSPQEHIEYNGTLTLQLDGCGTALSLSLHGSGGPMPQLVVSDTAYNFNSLNVGDSERVCITVTNPSCTPIVLKIDSSQLSNSFSVVSGDRASLQIGDTLTLCVQFKPTYHQASIGSLTLRSDSGGSRQIVFQGVGLAPDVLVTDTMLDFGYVLHGSSKTDSVHYTNTGNEIAVLTYSHADLQDFIVTPPTNLGVGASGIDIVTFKPQNTTGLVYDTLYYFCNGKTSRVILRGFGTEPGLQVSDSVLTFGKVHINTDSTLPLYLFATNNFPTIDSITPPRSTGPFTISNSVLPYTIKDDKDSLAIKVTYHPKLEEVDADSIVIHSGSIARTVRFVGKGVEAHPWVSPASVTFTGVVINTTPGVSPVTIGNNGEYPFHIDSVVLSGTSFLKPQISPSRLIWKDTSLLTTISFSPTRARHYSDTAKFYTSAGNDVLKVALEGTAIYPIGTGPMFGYKVDDRLQEEVGQYDTIPVTMFGQRLNMIDADSATLDIKFDPYMLKIHGGDAGARSQARVQYTVQDSIAHFSIVRSSFGADIVLRIYTEALLGPDPISTISVVSSDPKDVSTSNIPGTFAVVDCWGPVHGVTQAGQYKTNSIVPNPAGDKASLSFQLGWDGDVTIDVYNSVGQFAKHVSSGLLKAGPHTLTLDVGDLPQGRYVYRIRCLDYESSGALVILR